MPRSAFAALAFVNHISIRKRSNGCIVNLIGADAGETWYCELVVVDSRVTRRTIADGEFPDNFRETTTYVFSVPDT